MVTISTFPLLKVLLHFFNGHHLSDLIQAKLFYWEIFIIIKQTRMPSKEFKSQLFKKLWHLTVFILDNDVRNIQTSDNNLCITFNFSRYLYTHKFWFVTWSPMQIQHSKGLVLGKDTIVSTNIYCSLFIGGSLALRQNLKVRPFKENHHLRVQKLRVFFPNLLVSPWSVRFKNLQTVYQVEERKKAKQNEDCLCNKQYIKKYGYHCICLENILKIKKCTRLAKIKPTYKHITRR